MLSTFLILKTLFVAIGMAAIPRAQVVKLLQITATLLPAELSSDNLTAALNSRQHFPVSPLHCRPLCVLLFPLGCPSNDDQVTRWWDISPTTTCEGNRQMSRSISNELLWSETEKMPF